MGVHDLPGPIVEWLVKPKYVTELISSAKTGFNFVAFLLLPTWINFVLAFLEVPHNGNQRLRVSGSPFCIRVAMAIHGQ
jgi:hypothetical protein